MAWFKVDDKWWAHPKVIGLSGGARGVWVTCGSWSAAYLTDGYVPVRTLYLIAPGSRGRADQWAAELVDAGLWLRVDGGWTFHDWEQYQPSRIEVEEQRARDLERKRRGREAQRHIRALPPNP